MRVAEAIGATKAPRDCIRKEGMMKYNLRSIMLRAWKQFRKNDSLTFAECLHRAWLSEKAKEVNQERITTAATAAGITEEVNTWSGWQKAGYMVIHGSKALFQAVLIYGSRGDGATYKGSFFGRSQVEAIA